MIRMYARRQTQLTCPAGQDRVFFGLSLPSGSRINNVNIEVHLVSSSTNVQDRAAMYAVEGWILPVLDPDAATSFDVLWDNLVPKDTDVETMDLDTGATDATNFFEPGEPDLSDMFEVGLRPERIFHRNRLLTMAGGGSVFSFQDNQTPFQPNWIPGDRFDIRLKKNYGVSQPSVLLFAFASPNLDDTSTTVPSAMAEAEWGQVKYIGHVLERAMLHVFGVVETGAETPWEEATALLKKHLEPDVFEQDGGAFVGQTFDVFAKGIVDHSVEGTIRLGSVSTGR